MAQQKKGLIARLLEGKERSEEYARSTLPTNRWQLFFDIFKGNLGKLAKVNLLTILFFIPLLAVIVLMTSLSDYNGTIIPNNLGYPFYADLQGQEQAMNLWMDLTLWVGICLSSVIACIGLAGGMYVIRNIVWTEGVFVANDFWRGVKLNYKNALQTAIFFCLVMTFTTTMINIAEVSLHTPDISKGQKVWLYISEGSSYVFMTLGIMMTLWMIALGVNYKMGIFTLLRNSFLMSIGTFPQTIFFGLLAALPFVFFLLGGTLFILIAVILLLLIAISYALLVWLDFAQWVFDKFVNPKIKGAKVGRGIFNKDGSSTLTGEESASALEYQRIILSHGRSRLVARPIKPIDDSLQVYELPQAFTREDLQKLRESKKNIAEDTEAYAEEHKNDLRYVEYNKQFDERERALKEEDAKKGKKRGKKLKPPKMLNQ